MSNLGESLKDIMARTVELFESPEHQEKLAREAAQREELKREQRKTELRIKLRRADVPRRIASLLAEGGLDETSAMRSAGEHSEKLVLVLAGNPGSGKTVAACSAMLEAQSARLVRATEISELGTEYAARMFLAELRKVGLLVLDDLGIEQGEKRMSARLDDLVDARVSAHLRTIITSNLPGSVFSQRYGARIWSRIVGHGAYIELDDPDLRRRYR
jgi:DNA replication protein DnaC